MVRGGGAAHRYILNEPLENIKWLGRWGAQRTLGIYIQEMAALTFLDGLDN